MKYLGHEFAIVSEGTEITEYQVEFDDEKKRLTCWIASKAGKVRFRLRLFAPIGIFDPLDLSLGYALCGFVFSESNNSGKKGVIKFRGISISATEMRPFQFTSLETTDDDTYLGADDVKHIGEITAELWEVKLLGNRKKVFQDLPDPKVHERAKKAMAHRIGFGEPQATENTGAIGVSKERRIFEFVVRYRSLDFLQAEGIAPLAARLADSRSTAKIGEKRSADDQGLSEEGVDTDDFQAKDEAELKELLARVDTLQSRLAKNGKQAGSNKRVKTEPRPVKISTEIIDLTEE